MEKPERRYTKPWLVLGGLAFGVYLSLGLAYFETFPAGGAGAWWTYLAVGGLFSATCVFLGLRVLGSGNAAVSLWTSYLLPVVSLVLCGFAAFVVGGLLSGAPLGLELLGQVFFHLLLVGLLPVLAALILLPQAQPARIPEAEVQVMQADPGLPPASGMLLIEGLPGEVLLHIPTAQLCAVEAADNYCKFHYLQDGQRKSKLLRLTMKEAEELVMKAGVFHRCHRSFLVNPEMVEEVLGASQAYRLRMRGLEELVPVSRAFDIQALARRQP